MAEPLGGADRGLAARIRWTAVVLGFGMMMVGLSCFLALSSIKKRGRGSRPGSSLFLLRFLEQFGVFLSVYPLGVLTLFMFVARTCARITGIMSRGGDGGARVLKEEGDVRDSCGGGGLLVEENSAEVLVTREVLVSSRDKVVQVAVAEEEAKRGIMSK